VFLSILGILTVGSVLHTDPVGLVAMNGTDGLDEYLPEALTRSIEIEPTATHPPPPGIHETAPSWKFVDTSLLVTPEVTADFFVQIAGVRAS
jgi:hypothetical protein